MNINPFIPGQISIPQQTVPSVEKSVSFEVQTPPTMQKADLKEKVKTLFSQQPTSVQEMAKALRQEFSGNPEIQTKIDAFEEKYAKNMETIKEKGWTQLKGERGLDMTKPCCGEPVSMQEFRDAANALVDEITGAIGKELGLPKVNWTASGTAGYNSDVDTALLPPKEGIDTVDACLYKSIRDAVHVSIFGGPSGIQLDTESYIPHSAKLNTLGSLYADHECHRTFQTHEMANIALQRYVSLEKHPEEYQKSKDADLKSISDPEQKKAMTIVYAQIEAFMEHLNCEIKDLMLQQNGFSSDQVAQMSDKEKQEASEKIMHDKPHAFKKAREITMVPMRLALAEKCGQIEKQIALKQAETGGVATHSHAMQINKLILAKNRIYTLLNLLQDEGTNSQSEGKVTLLQEGGQIYAGAQKKAVKKIDAEYEKQTGINKHLVQKGRSPLLHSLAMKGSREMLQPKGFEKSSAETLMVAAYEESAQFEHVINDGLRKAKGKKTDAANLIAGQTAISAGKYCQRTTRNLLKALKDIKNKCLEKGIPLPKGYNSLKSRAKVIEGKATQLERCKRKFSMNTEATQKLLGDAITARLTPRRPVDRIKLDADIMVILNQFEMGGKYDGVIMKKSEQLTILVDELEVRGYIKSASTKDSKGKVKKFPTDPEIKKILQARVGYNREKSKHADLIPIHEKADAITLQKLKLSSSKEVKDFAHSVIKIGEDVRNMAIEHGIMQKASVSDANHLDFLELLLSCQAELAAPSSAAKAA